MNKNIYKQFYKQYLEKGITVVPDGYGKQKYALTGLTEFFHKELTLEEAAAIANVPKLDKEGSNLAVLLGKCSNLVALDLDTTDKSILEKIEPLLPESPVEKKGSKGWTRFFRYPNTGQETEILKDSAGNVVLEILSNNKKTTIPPSRHPNGEDYFWSSDKTLLDVNTQELPVLPPTLIPILQQLLGGTKPSTNSEWGKVSEGRNSALSSHLGKLLGEAHTMETIVEGLLEFDRQNHETPYFTDGNEHRSTHAVTNALSFYVSHLESINSKRYRESKQYVTPHLGVSERMDAGPIKGAKKEDQRVTSCPHCNKSINLVHEGTGKKRITYVERGGRLESSQN